ncbi:DUF3489 domain-containing protein [Methylobacterium marchantiae]|uniref:DUF3489 domain-containing protein n=1 Tax=Methylobacterium marchantiae TaxID=600331 RepID=A0ABW3X1J5_9HYPH|nr:hypothetical protein AIGOOFII_2946 [Methylobacterium marchantiae]
MSIVIHPALSRNDAALLIAAANRPDGRVVLPETITPLACKRTVGRLLKRGLIAVSEAHELAGETAHDLTPAGYAAVGMTPPVPVIPAVEDGATLPPTTVSKREFVLGLLSRAEGASLAELIAITGWLPHTTRAVLSRLRSAGRILAKSKRADGATAYRIMPEEPEARPKSSRGPARRKDGETHAVAAAV